ncbi:MAG: hypothetical protein ACRELZ_06130 [Candidatus Rokuibacteriota bacterium]
MEPSVSPGSSGRLGLLQERLRVPAASSAARLDAGEDPIARARVNSERW